MELTTLTAVDNAFENYLAAIFDPMSRTTGPKAFLSFLARPDREKIFRTRPNESPIDALKELVASGAHDKAGPSAAPGKTKKRNTPLLPVVLYGRQPGFMADDEQIGSLLHGQVFWNEARTVSYRADFLPVTMTYQVLFITSDVPTREAMEFSWYRRISDVRGGANRFPVLYQLEGEPLDGLTAEIKSPQMYAPSDVSLPSPQGKLFGVLIDVEVAATVLSGECVTVPESFGLVHRWGVIP